jgi:hypothetical protein
MRSPQELKELFEFARENDLPWIEVDGVKLPVSKRKQEISKDQETPEIFADEAAKYTEEEILFYATPYFDELQARKAEKEKRVQEEAELRRTG